MSVKMLKNSIRGWLPEDVYVISAHKPTKSRLKRHICMTLTLVMVIALVFFSIFTLFSSGTITAFIRATNPERDITSLGYYKMTNSSSVVEVGDVIEVQTSVQWLGFSPERGNSPEFERRVEIVDPYPESSFQLISGTNELQYNGYGRESQLTYLLKVIDNTADPNELSIPKLYLDGTEILFGTKK